MPDLSQGRGSLHHHFEQTTALAKDSIYGILKGMVYYSIVWYTLLEYGIYYVTTYVFRWAPVKLLMIETLHDLT